LLDINKKLYEQIDIKNMKIKELTARIKELENSANSKSGAVDSEITRQDDISQLMKKLEVNI